jgi:peptidoglycan/xylan/chitin deacetylase (PgdA/CDA1 family)
MTVPVVAGTAGLVISLDFELHWGVRDHAAVDGPYRANLLGARKAVPEMLDVFTEYGIRATWATVGALFAADRDELEHYWPQPRPHYENQALDPYDEPVGRSERDDPLHYAASLIERIAQAPHQELGSHTFTHYYCCERGQDEETFRADLSSAVAIARSRGVELRSLALPRNQVNPDYEQALRDAGFTSYRGNQCGWMHGGIVTGEHLRRRAARVLDAYVPLSGSGVGSWPDGRQPVNVAASRFLRPWSPRIRLAEPVRLSRITRAMTAAAETGGLFHLWWHPHNFGVDLPENLAVLRNVLAHYRRLFEKHDMRSLSMLDVATATGMTA